MREDKTVRLTPTGIQAYTAHDPLACIVVFPQHITYVSVSNTITCLVDSLRRDGVDTSLLSNHIPFKLYDRKSTVAQSEDHTTDITNRTHVGCVQLQCSWQLLDAMRSRGVALHFLPDTRKKQKKSQFQQLRDTEAPVPSSLSSSPLPQMSIPRILRERSVCLAPLLLRLYSTTSMGSLMNSIENCAHTHQALPGVWCEASRLCVSTAKQAVFAVRTTASVDSEDMCTTTVETADVSTLKLQVLSLADYDRVRLRCVVDILSNWSLALLCSGGGVGDDGSTTATRLRALKMSSLERVDSRFFDHYSRLHRYIALLERCGGEDRTLNRMTSSSGQQSSLDAVSCSEDEFVRYFTEPILEYLHLDIPRTISYSSLHSLLFFIQEIQSTVANANAFTYSTSSATGSPTATRSTSRHDDARLHRLIEITKNHRALFSLSNSLDLRSLCVEAQKYITLHDLAHQMTNSTRISHTISPLCTRDDATPPRSELRRRKQKQRLEETRENTATFATSSSSSSPSPVSSTPGTDITPTTAKALAYHLYAFVCDRHVFSDTDPLAPQPVVAVHRILRGLRTVNIDVRDVSLRSSSNSVDKHNSSSSFAQRQEEQEKKNKRQQQARRQHNLFAGAHYFVHYAQTNTHYTELIRTSVRDIESKCISRIRDQDGQRELISPLHRFLQRLDVETIAFKRALQKSNHCMPIVVDSKPVELGETVTLPTSTCSDDDSDVSAESTLQRESETDSRTTAETRTDVVDESTLSSVWEEKSTLSTTSLIECTTLDLPLRFRNKTPQAGLPFQKDALLYYEDAFVLVKPAV